jgi:hypothetical protein
MRLQEVAGHEQGSVLLSGSVARAESWRAPQVRVAGRGRLLLKQFCCLRFVRQHARTCEGP